MSHIRETSVVYRDLDSLEEAVKECGGQFMRNQKTYNWFERFVNDSTTGRQFAKERGVGAMGHCEHAIRSGNHVGRDYEIGVIKALDGDGYKLVLDDWGSGRKLAQAFGGKELPLIKQNYAAILAEKQARKKLARQGFTTSRETLSSGVIRVHVRRRS